MFFLALASVIVVVVNRPHLAKRYSTSVSFVQRYEEIRVVLLYRHWVDRKFRLPFLVLLWYLVAFAAALAAAATIIVKASLFALSGANSSLGKTNAFSPFLFREM